MALSAIPIQPTHARPWATWLTAFALLAASACAGGVESESAAAQAALPQAAPEPSSDMTTSPGLIHQVYFWLDPTLDEAARQDFVAGMKSLSAAPTVRRVMVGPPAATPQRDVTDKTFDYMLVLWFDDVAGHDAYQIDPVHLAFVKAHEAKFKTVKVFDAEVL